MNCIVLYWTLLEGDFKPSSGFPWPILLKPEIIGIKVITECENIAEC
jgi:hypothetical protein